MFVEQVSVIISIASFLSPKVLSPCVLTMQSCVWLWGQCAGHSDGGPSRCAPSYLCAIRKLHGWLDDGWYFPDETWKHYDLLILITVVRKAWVSIQGAEHTTIFSPCSSWWSRAAHIMETIFSKRQLLEKQGVLWWHGAIEKAKASWSSVTFYYRSRGLLKY